MKSFDPNKKNRLFNKSGKEIDAENLGDVFRLYIIKTLKYVIEKEKMSINSIIDIGSGPEGGFGKGLAGILKVPRKNLFQADLVSNEKFRIHKGNIITGEGLPNKVFDLGLLIQVLKDIKNLNEIVKSIRNITKHSVYSIITCVDPQISTNENYFNFKWLDQDTGYCVISTKFFDNSIRKYTPFYVQDRLLIENIINERNQKILYSESWKNTYNFWILKNPFC